MSNDELSLSSSPAPPVASTRLTVPRGKQGTWWQAISSLVFSILFILSIRWALFEPYVIPSGSMIPNLLVHDHILVNKFAYGLRLPFTKVFVKQWAQPRRGDVIVFHSTEEKDIFLVKRVVGLPGDKIEYDENSHLIINGQPIPTREVPMQEVNSFLNSWPQGQRHHYEEDFRFLNEDFDGREHFVIRRQKAAAVHQGPFEVPQDQLFMMGDNRDNSSDSRVWGFLPLDHVLGRASLIWLSCEETLASDAQICDPRTVRWSRMFKVLR